MRAVDFKTNMQEQDLFEINMSPGNLEKLASDIRAVAGMEFEMIVPVPPAPSKESEADMSYDRRARSIEDVLDFFRDENPTASLRRLERTLTDEYQEWAITEWHNDGFSWFKRWFISDEVREDTAEYIKDKLIKDDPTLAEPDNSQKLFSKINALTDERLTKIAEAVWKEEGDDYQAAFDDWRSEQRETEFFRDNGLRYMSDFYESFGDYLSWPYWTEADDDEVEVSLADVAKDFQAAISRPVEFSATYHGAKRKQDTYVIEPDGSLEPGENESGLEFVSPPLYLNEILDDLDKVRKWAGLYGCYTNSSTGLHINVSVLGMENLDFVKLALLLGDEYILNQFGRLGNVYCESAISKIKNKMWRNPEDVETLLGLMKHQLQEMASKVLHNGFTQKYTSINTKQKYVEFRSPGGDWLDENFDKIKPTLLRFVVALDAAVNPQKYKQEYLKKLHALLKPTTIKYYDPKDAANLKNPTKFVDQPVKGYRTYVPTFDAEFLTVLAKYMTGSITQADWNKMFKSYLKIAQQEKSKSGTTSEKPQIPSSASVQSTSQSTPSTQPTTRWRVMIDGQVVHTLNAPDQNSANEAGRTWILSRSREFLQQHQGGEVEIIPDTV